MSRLLLLIALVALAIWLFRKIYLPSARSSSNVDKTNDQPALMKKCSVCELHLPENQGVTDEQGKFYCSQEHLKQNNKA